jgi:hypothetical protein
MVAGLPKNIKNSKISSKFYDEQITLLEHNQQKFGTDQRFSKIVFEKYNRHCGHRYASQTKDSGFESPL